MQDAAPFVSVEEYLRTSCEPGCEYVDGALIPKEPPKNKHSVLQMLIIERLYPQSRALHLAVRPELRIRTAATRLRVPDVCVYEGVLRAEVPSDPPLLTVEVVSDTEPMSALTAKLRDHLSMGTRMALIVDPYERTALIQDANGMRSLEGENVLRLETKKGVLTIDVDALLAELDRELSGE